jgi:hypothetical protein
MKINKIYTIFNNLSLKKIDINFRIKYFQFINQCSSLQIHRNQNYLDFDD